MSGIAKEKLQFEFVLPCYNEAKSLQILVERCVDAAKRHAYSPSQFQLVLVENGSRDDSSAIMDQIGKTPLGDWFRKVSVGQNQGYGFGLWVGLQTTTASFVGYSHADEQCDPEDAFRALEKLRSLVAEQECRVLVKGVRTGRKMKDAFVTHVFAILARLLLGGPFEEINAQPKVFHRELLLSFTNPPKTFAFDLYALYQAYKAGFRILTFPVKFSPRVHGTSNWSAGLRSRIKTIVDMIRYMTYLSKTEGRISGRI